MRVWPQWSTVTFRPHCLIVGRHCRYRPIIVPYLFANDKIYPSSCQPAIHALKFKQYVGLGQYVKIKDPLSDNVTLSYGVPRGSVLGPVLYISYTTPPSASIASFDLKPPSMLMILKFACLYQYLRTTNSNKFVVSHLKIKTSEELSLYLAQPY